MNSRVTASLVATLWLTLPGCDGGRTAPSQFNRYAYGGPLSGGGVGNWLDAGIPNSGGPSVGGAGSDTGGQGDDVDAGAAAPDAGDDFALIGAPLVFAPTTHGFGLNVVLGVGDPYYLRAYVREGAGTDWQAGTSPRVPAADVAQWSFDSLRAGTLYEYKIVVSQNGHDKPLYSGKVTTQREPGTAFSFAVLADTHISPRPVEAGDLSAADSFEQTLLQVSNDIGASSPDFTITLGDMLDFHQFGFNQPPPDGSWTRWGYLNYRRLFNDTLGNAAHYTVIGNWDGENGCFTTEQVARSRDQRLLYLPGPAPDTYPQSGSSAEDYYAFTWGDALFVVLNVMSYTPTWHLLSGNPGVPDDWTLGGTQMAWLESTLQQTSAKWKFLFIHHTVGGSAGDYDDSAYGRGGGQAAHVGEQAIIHDLMLNYGVQIFFYGHDHVFTDIVVDDVHYTLPGSAGAIWKFTQSQTGYTSFWTQSGFGRVQVSPQAVDVQFVAMGGEVIYEYSIP